MKILHLYHDMMNLYGEYANLLILERCLRDLGQEVEIHTLSMGESKDIGGYDMYFMGAGTERKQKLTLEALRPYGQALKKAHEEGSVFLFTGNSFELMGKSLVDVQGNEHPCLGLFSFTTQEGDRRIVGDALGSCELFSEAVVGFMNKCTKTTGVEKPLVSLKMGFGNEADCSGEGVLDRNFFGTHLTGPILMKNPAMLREILGRLMGSPVESVNVPYLQQAYETTSKALQNRLETTK